MQVIQITPGRFHHFHLARQIERFGKLDAIYTGYPSFKLKDETGIPKDKIHTFPWLMAPFMKRKILGLHKWWWLSKQWEWATKQSLDHYVAKNLNKPCVLITLSGSGLQAMKKNKALGGLNICDRGSTHIVFQDAILKEEYKRWGDTFKGIDSRVIQKEIQEYELADFITVPSSYVKNTFIEQGVAADKIKVIPYGANLQRFQKVAEPNANQFQVLWVGAVSLRKGFLYLLEAFNLLDYPQKKLVVIGSIAEEIKPLLINYSLTSVDFKGNVPNAHLKEYYSNSHVLVLTSIEEGLAMVQGEALACGCPVIATPNTGCEEIISDGVEGFIVEVRNVSQLTQKLSLLAHNPNLRAKMSDEAIKRVKSIGGWDTYGNVWRNLLNDLIA